MSNLSPDYYGAIAAGLLDKRDIRLAYIYYEILVLIGEKVLHNIIDRNIIGRGHPYKEHGTRDIAVESQLTRL